MFFLPLGRFHQITQSVPLMDMVDMDNDNEDNANKDSDNKDNDNEDNSNDNTNQDNDNEDNNNDNEDKDNEDNDNDMDMDIKYNLHMSRKCLDENAEPKSLHFFLFG